MAVKGARDPFTKSRNRGGRCSIEPAAPASLPRNPGECIVAAMVPVIVKLPPSILAALDQLPQDGLRKPPSRSEVIREAIVAHLEAMQRKPGHG